jgi:hypothetical protein
VCPTCDSSVIRGRRIVVVKQKKKKRERLEGSYLRTFALELREQLAQTLAAFVMSMLAQPRGHPDVEEDNEPPLLQIIDVLQQVMCTHDAEKLAISVLEIYENRDRLLPFGSPVGKK